MRVEVYDTFALINLDSIMEKCFVVSKERIDWKGNIEKILPLRQVAMPLESCENPKRSRRSFEHTIQLR